MYSRNARWILLLSCSAVFFGGCSWFFVLPPEAVLEGTWSLQVAGNPDLSKLYLTFDRYGDLQTIQYQVGDNALITVPSPVSQTNVTGNAVSIAASFSGNTLAFTGTLDSAQDVATGSLTTLITFDGIIISINNGAATMTRQ